MKKRIFGGAIAALMLSSSLVFAADAIVPEPAPPALLDNVPIADNKGVWSFGASLGIGYIDFGDFASREIVGDPNAAWLNIREESADVSVPTLNIGFTAIRELEHKPYNVFIDVGAFVGLSDGEARTDMRQEENLNFVPDPDVLLVATGTEKDPSSVTEDVGVWGLTAAVGPEFDVGRFKAKVGPSARCAFFSGGGLDNQCFVGGTLALDLSEVNNWTVASKGSYEWAVDDGDNGFKEVGALSIELKRSF